MTPEERSRRASIAANMRWARTPDRLATAVAGQRGLQERFEREVDPEGKLAPEVRAKLAENLRKAHFKSMAEKSAKARKNRKNAA